MSRYKAMLRYENTVPGIFVRRVNRFVAEVLIDGKAEQVHVKNPNRKTAYDLISVYKPGLKWVNIDSLAPNALMKQYLTGRDFDVVKPEFTYGDSRFDFYMERRGEKYLTEVKGCTLTADPRTGIGFFPDAPTERGTKHLNELAEAEKNGYHCTICFVIQMNGVHIVYPNNATQPEFGQALIQAAKAGVGILYYSCHVEADSIKITGEMCDNRYAQM